MTRDELIELIVETVREKMSQAGGEDRMPDKTGANPSGHKVGFHVRERFVRSYTTLPARRRFLSEYEVRRMVSASQAEGSVPKEFVVPPETILSPLAEDWLRMRGIRILLDGKKGAESKK